MDKTAPIILHIDIDNESLLDWLKTNRFVVYSELVRFADKLIRQDLAYVQAMIVANLSENIVFILKQEDVKFTLERALQFFLKLEEYEQCSKIRDLLILIENKKKNASATA